MNIAVIGTGMVGRLIAVELSKKYQVYAINLPTIPVPITAMFILIF